MERHTFAIAVVLLASSSARAQSAEQPTFSLSWTAPEGCPDAPVVEAEVLRLAGHPPATPMQVRATVTREGERFRIAIVTSSEAGEGAREIEGASCDAVAEAAALVVAMAIDPEAATRTAPDPDPLADPVSVADSVSIPVAVSVSDPVPVVDPAADADTDRATALGPSARAPAPVAATTPSASFLAAAHATLGAGLLPMAAPGVALALGARIDAIEIWAAAHYLAEHGVERDDYTASFWSIGAHLRGCIPVALGTPLLELAPCGGLQLGVIGGTGHAVPRATSAAVIVGAVEILADVRLWLAREVALTAFGELDVAFDTPRFVVETGPRSSTVLHRPENVAFLGGLGVMLRVP